MWEAGRAVESSARVWLWVLKRGVWRSSWMWSLEEETVLKGMMVRRVGGLGFIVFFL